MEKGYYIHGDLYLDGKLAFPGVQRKIEQQVRVMAKSFDMTVLPLERKGNKIAKRFLPGSRLFHWEKVFRRVKDPAFLYIRKVMLDQGILTFLEEVKRKSPGVKVIMELPTYPYDKEQFFNTPFNYPLFLRDLLTRQSLKKYVDRIVSFSQDNRLFGIPTIRTMNGIDLSEIDPRSSINKDDRIHLLAVATFQDHHGYERMIRGLSNYYRDGGKRDIVLDMVGSGTALEGYKKLTETLEMEGHVIFHGPKYGDELNEFYDMADIGLATFGAYKTNIHLLSSLKVREYLACGLPIAGGGREDVFEEKPSPYFLRYPNDPSDVDIGRLMRFYDKCYAGRDRSQVITELRQYAEENVTWDKCLEAVMRFIEG